jgi:hypothetical protein
MTVMFEELSKPTKDKERLKSRAYATIMTNYGGLNVELYGDRAPKTVYNFVQLAKKGYYDGVIFHRLIPGFMVSFAVPSHKLTPDPRRRPDGHGAGRQVVLGRAIPGRVCGQGRIQARVARRALDGKQRAQHQRLPVLHHVP